MLIQNSFQDVETPTGTMRVHIVSPKLPAYPEAKWPGVVVFSEIYQVTGPVLRYAELIASHGYVVAAPCVFHEFAGPTALAYDVEGTDKGNDYKVRKLLKAYDDDATASIDLLVSLKNCNGRIATTGMCLGGHLAFRCAFDPRILAACCFFPTDIHDEKLGTPTPSDSLIRAQEIKGELLMILGVNDTHVDLAGRSHIRNRLNDLGTTTTWMEVQAGHAFIRDELSKGRFDGALTRNCVAFMLELFDRTIGRDLGPKTGSVEQPAHVC